MQRQPWALLTSATQNCGIVHEIGSYSYIRSAHDAMLSKRADIAIVQVADDSVSVGDRVTIRDRCCFALDNSLALSYLRSMQTELDTSALAMADTIYYNANGAWVDFYGKDRTGMYNVRVVSLNVRDGAYRVAGGTQATHQSQIIPYGRAWQRCLAFIEQNSLVEAL